MCHQVKYDQLGQARATKSREAIGKPEGRLNSGNEETGEKSDASSLPNANLGRKFCSGFEELRGEPFSTEVEVELGDLLSTFGG